MNKMATTICNVLALGAILSSFIVINQAVKNAVNAVLWLIIAFVCVACYLVTAGITFIGLSYIIVYVGAIAVLFLFVVIILNIANIDSNSNSNFNTTSTNEVGSNSKNIWPLAIIIFLGVFTIIPIVGLIIETSIADIPIIDIIHSIIWGYEPTIINTNYFNVIDLNANISQSNQILSLGITLYAHGVLWLIIISILLILAILVPLCLAFTLIPLTLTLSFSLYLL